MTFKAVKINKGNHRSISNSRSKAEPERRAKYGFIDKRPTAVAQRKIQELAENVLELPNNKQLAHPTTKKWMVGASQIHGKGIIATNDLKPKEKVDVAGDKANSDQINITKNFGAFINHQSEKKANAKVAEEGSSLILKTNQSVKRGSEITANYDDTPSYIAKSETTYRDATTQLKSSREKFNTGTVPPGNWQAMANNSPRAQRVVQLQAMANDYSAQKPSLMEKKQKRGSSPLATLQMQIDPVQLIGSDSGIPQSLIDFLGSVEAYHQIKQKHWAWISQAHEQSHGSPPGTTGAKYTIDAGTANELISILRAKGYQEGTGRRDQQEEHALSKQALARQEEREKSVPVKDSGAVKQIKRHFGNNDFDLDAVYGAMPTDIIQKGRKAQVAWLKQNY